MQRTVQYIAGTEEMLFHPLSDGTCLISADVPLTITDERDYNRLILSGKYKDVTPETPNTTSFVVPQQVQVATTPAPTVEKETE